MSLRTCHNSTVIQNIFKVLYYLNAQFEDPLGTQEPVADRENEWDRCQRNMKSVKLHFYDVFLVDRECVAILRTP